MYLNPRKESVKRRLFYSYASIMTYKIGLYADMYLAICINIHVFEEGKK